MTDVELVKTVGTWVLSSSGGITLLIWAGKRAVKHYYELKEKSELLKDELEKERFKRMQNLNEALSEAYKLVSNITSALQANVAHLEDITKSHGAEIARLRMSIQAFDRGLETLKAATQKTESTCSKMITFIERFTKRFDKKILEQDDKLNEFGRIFKIWETKKGDQ